MKLKALIPFFIPLTDSAFAGNHSKCDMVLASAGGQKITMGEFTARFGAFRIYSEIQDNLSPWFSNLNNKFNGTLPEDYDDNLNLYNNSEHKIRFKWGNGKSVPAYLKWKKADA